MQGKLNSSWAISEKCLRKSFTYFLLIRQEGTSCVYLLVYIYPIILDIAKKWKFDELHFNWHPCAAPPDILPGGTVDGSRDKEIKANKCHFDVTTNYTRLYQISFPVPQHRGPAYPEAGLLMGSLYQPSRSKACLITHSPSPNSAQGGPFPCAEARFRDQPRTREAHTLFSFFFGLIPREHRCSTSAAASRIHNSSSSSSKKTKNHLCLENKSITAIEWMESACFER